jgi:putative ABC transport system permease protein
VIGYRARRLLGLAAKSISLHRLRSFLTTLGIVFGVAAVVTMLAIGEGASEEAQAQIARLGSRNLIVQSVKPPESTSPSSSRSWAIEYGLTRADVRAVRETVPGVRRVVPRRDLPMELWNGARHVTGVVFGTDPAYREAARLSVDRGRFLSEEDGAKNPNVCVIGAAVAESLFPGEDPLDGSVKAGGDYYRVVGVAARRGTAPPSGAGASGEEDVAIFVPVEAALERFGALIVQRTSGSRVNERVELHRLIVETNTVEDVPAAAAALRSLLAKRHAKQDVRLTVPLELLEEAARSKRLFTIVLASIAAISLLVGGIGIMNIMLASVTERTREIGIRRALGARRRDIVLQFLSETAMLSGVGGVTGLAVGVFLPKVVTHVFGMATIVTPFSLMLSFGVCAAVGILFGFYPASRAARLDPVEALRHD